MTTSYGALCTDFYINVKLALKMDLPGERETVLHLCDRVKKSVPSMNRFHRYEAELVLESSRREIEYQWMSLRRTSVRTGHVNPKSMSDSYKYHKLVLGIAPTYLSISPLDVDYLELLLGFDLECKANHDQVVFDALYAHTPLAGLMQMPDSHIQDIQPVFGLSLTPGGELQAYFEVKTRSRTRRGNPSRYAQEPLSVLLTLRRYGPLNKVEELDELFDTLCRHAENLATEQLVPTLLTPIARAIPSSSA